MQHSPSGQRIQSHTSSENNWCNFYIRNIKIVRYVSCSTIICLVSVDGLPKWKEFYDAALFLAFSRHRFFFLAFLKTSSCLISFRNPLLNQKRLQMTYMYVMSTTIENYDVLTYLDWAVQNFHDLFIQHTLISILIF